MIPPQFPVFSPSSLPDYQHVYFPALMNGITGGMIDEIFRGDGVVHAAVPFHSRVIQVIHHVCRVYICFYLVGVIPVFLESDQSGTNDKEDDSPRDHVLAEYGSTFHFMVYGNRGQHDNGDIKDADNDNGGPYISQQFPGLGGVRGG